MRSFLSSALAAGCGLAMAAIAIDPASAKFRSIGSQSTDSLRRSCAANGGTFGTGAGGEHYCEKGGNLIDCNGKNQCIGGTPRGGRATSGTGGTAATGTKAYLGAVTRASGQGTRPAADLAQPGRHHR